MSFIVGVTGGIGSGKTAVSDRFAQLGIEVVDADVVARVVVEPETQALQAIADKFGKGILHSDGTLDRAKLRNIIFASDMDKQWLEQLLHPLIGERILHDLENASSPYVVFVSPLLVESGQTSICDKVVVVDVPESVQLSRTMERDSNAQAQVEAIMAKQTSRENRLSHADEVIENWHGFEQLDSAVNELHQHFLTLAQHKVSANA